MFSSAEKSTQVSRQQSTAGATFFRKAGEENFFHNNKQTSFFSPPVQAKLSVSSPDDPQEKEADAVADRVMRVSEPAAISAPGNKEEEKLQKQEEKEQEPMQAKAEIPAIQREEKKEEVQAQSEPAQADMIQRMEEKKEEVHAKREMPVITTLQRSEDKKELQAKSYKSISRKENDNTNADTVSSADTGSVIQLDRKKSSLYHSDIIQRSGRGPPENHIPFEQSLSSSKGGGSPLPDNTRQFMESRFDTDFSGVKIHTGSTAETLSNTIHAQAFAHGNDIYFNSGKYSPNTADGGALLAHELTHTIQQGASKQTTGIQQRKLGNKLLTKPIRIHQSTTAQKKSCIQAKLEKFSKPGHGANANKRLKKEAEQQASEERSKAEPREGTREEIKAEKRSRKQTLRPVGTPEINESKIQVPKTRETKNKTKEKIEKPSKNNKKEKHELKLKGKQTPAGYASLSRSSIARAHTINTPTKPTEIKHVAFFQPKDAAGKELQVNTSQFMQYASIGIQIQETRDKGHELIEMGCLHEQQSHLIEAQVHAARSLVAESDSNLHLIDQGIDARREAHQKGSEALQLAENRQQTVETTLPSRVQAINEAKNDSGDAAAETRLLHSESASNQPDDPDERGDSQEMGSQLGTVSNDTSSVDRMFLQSQQNTNALSEATQLAKAKNTVSRSAIMHIGQGVVQMTNKSSQLKNANQQANSEIDNQADEPMQVRVKAIEMKTEGSLMIQRSIALERKLHETAQHYEKNLIKVPPLIISEETSESNNRNQIHRQPEGDYARRVDLFEGTILDERTRLTVERRRELEQEALRTNQVELDYIKNELPGDFNRYGFWTKVRVGLGAKLNRFKNWLGRLGIAGVLGGIGSLLVAMFNPMTYVMGVLGGFTQVVNGAYNFGRSVWNGDFWGAVKSLADVATGIATVAGTIAGLALMIELALTAILIISAIFSFGASAVALAPAIAFVGKVMVVSGTIALWAGGAAVILNLIAGIKSLVDMGNAESAEQLQAETNDFTQDMGGVVTGLLNMWVGSTALSGPARLASSAAYANRLLSISARQGAAAAARVVGNSIVSTLRNLPKVLWETITLKNLRNRARRWITGEPVVEPVPEPVRDPRAPAAPVGDTGVVVETANGTVTVRPSKLDWLLNRGRPAESALAGLSDLEIENLAKSIARSRGLAEAGVRTPEELTALIRRLYESSPTPAGPLAPGANIKGSVTIGGKTIRGTFQVRPGTSAPEFITLTLPEDKALLSTEMSRLFRLRDAQRLGQQPLMPGWLPPPPQPGAGTDDD